MNPSRLAAVVVRSVLVVTVLAAAVWTRGCTRWPVVYLMTGPSMEPTVRAGEYFIATSPAGRLQRGALVLFRYTDEDGEFHVLRRLAALAGDTVEMRAGRVLLNGRLVSWPFRVLEPAAWRSPLAIGGNLLDWGPVVVPAGSVFLLADTRDMIGWPDSRFIGPVPESAVVARAGRIVWSEELRRLLRKPS